MGLRVMIVDDHKIFRHALAEMLADAPAIDVVAEVGDGAEALARAALCQPDVVCMDISMPRMSGIDATRALRAAQPQIRIVGLSAYAEQHLVGDMLAAGACAYVNKESAATELLPLLLQIAAGQPPAQSDTAAAA